MDYMNLKPKNVRQLAESVSSEMREEMKSVVLEGRTHAYMGFKVGEVYIEVEIPAWESPNEDSVQIIHADMEHRSPRIEEAIREKLPTWAEAERDAQESKEEWDAIERAQWLDRYN